MWVTREILALYILGAFASLAALKWSFRVIVHAVRDRKHPRYAPCEHCGKLTRFHVPLNLPTRADLARLVADVTTPAAPSGSIRP